MKTLLSLLLCCVLVETVKVEAVSENDIPHQGHYGTIQGTEQHDITGEVHRATSADAAFTCQPDIHTVLREMSALVAKLEVELKYTKAQMEVLDTQIGDSEKVIQQLLQENKDLKLSVNGVKEELEQQVSAVNLTGSRVDELRRDRKDSRVSFSASLVDFGSETRGPFNTATTLVYRHVFTNTGNAYNPNSGIFTAPLKGVYQFYFALHGRGSEFPNAVSLRRNNVHVVFAWGLQPSHIVNSSNGVSLLLEVGDVVYLQLKENARVFDDENRHTTFSGHLLFKV